jgi:N-acetylglutamate synthase-like GNAT family acetyltransferase
MFQIALMHQEDFEFAAELANTMNWNMAPEDFQFAVTLEPQGCFVAKQDSECVGVATCISYGTVGWFGNLIVKQETRNHGAGSQLVRHAIEYLRSKGVKTIGLYAYPNLTGFYSKLGFVRDEDFVVLNAKSLSAIQAENLKNVEKRNLLAVEKFDLQCFGGDRRKLLESIVLEKGNLSYCIFENNMVVGYVAATVYEKMTWIGPLNCIGDRNDVAVSLLKAILAKLSGKNVAIAIPKRGTIFTDLLLKCGFSVDFSVCRMFFGNSVAKSCIYVAESLERG